MDIKTVSNQVPVRIYTPDGHDNELPIIIYFHGGSWRWGFNWNFNISKRAI